MRVAFIDPPGINRGINIGLGLLAAVLKQRGHLVKVVDLNNNPGDAQGRVDAIAGYDAIGFSVKSFTWKETSRLAGRIGRRDLICGGPHITLDAAHVLQESPYFKTAVTGEAETSIAGILERGNGGSDQGPVADLDMLPYPDYGCFDSLGSRIPDYPVITSRGCPYSCVYCCVGRISGKKIRFRSIENVVSEIAEAKSRYGAGSFQILDDNFTFDVCRAKNFCRMLLDRGIGMTWTCPNGIRADRLDEELVDLMVRSGCRQVSIGIESLDAEVFSNIKKGEGHREIKDAVRLFKKYRVRVSGFFMIGLPKDTLARSAFSLESSLKLGLNSSHWNIFTPYPGTESWEWVKQNARLVQDWREGAHFGPQQRVVFETAGFSQKEKAYFYKLANIRSRNYQAFLIEQDALIINVLKLGFLILRYDFFHIFSHLRYLFGRRRDIGRYLHNNGEVF